MAASLASVSQSSQRPIKGILKNKSSTVSSPAASAEQQPSRSVDEMNKKSQRWDEMNILVTYYPTEEDYGLINVQEPSTPDHSRVGDDEDALSDSETIEGLTPDMLTTELVAEGAKPNYGVCEKVSAVDEDNDLSTEEQGKQSLLSACCLFFFKCSVGSGQGEEKSQLQGTSRRAEGKKRQFEMKRKLYDNEGLHIKLAKQLISKDLNEEEEEEEVSKTADGESMNMEESNQGSAGDQLQNKSPSS